MAAKGKYEQWLTKEGLKLLEGWARNGLTDEQIAHNCGIVPQTLYTWKATYEEINAALKKGKEVIDLEVENALLKRALGYDYEEVMTEESEMGFKRRTTTKHVLPDVTAQIFWLKNRKPNDWRNVKSERSPSEGDDSALGVVEIAPVLAETGGDE